MYGLTCLELGGAYRMTDASLLEVRAQARAAYARDVMLRDALRPAADWLST